MSRYSASEELEFLGQLLLAAHKTLQNSSSDNFRAEIDTVRAAVYDLHNKIQLQSKTKDEIENSTKNPLNIPSEIPRDTDATESETRVNQLGRSGNPGANGGAISRESKDEHKALGAGKKTGGKIQKAISKPKKDRKKRATAADSGPEVLLLPCSEKPDRPLNDTHQPKYVRIPENLLCSKLPSMSRLLGMLDECAFEFAVLNDTVIYDPKFTHKPKRFIGAKAVYVDALMESSFAKVTCHSGAWGLNGMKSKHVWMLFKVWIQWAKSGELRWKESPNFVDDVLDMGGFLGVDEDYLDELRDQAENASGSET